MANTTRLHTGGRVAGVLLFIMGIFTVPLEVLSPEDPARWVNGVVAVMGLWLGLSLAWGNARWLRLTQASIVVSSLICIPLYASKHGVWGVAPELWLLVGWGLLLVGTPKRPRIGFAIGMFGPALVMLALATTTKLEANLAPTIDSVTGKAFAYRLRMPPDRWRLQTASLPALQADRMIATPDDQCTVATVATAKTQDSLDEFAARTEAGKAGIVHETILSPLAPLPTHVGVGMVIEQKDAVVMCRDAFFVKDGRSLWISGCAAPDKFESCRADVDAIFATVEMP